MMANLTTSPRRESVRKHRAPNGALRPVDWGLIDPARVGSENTERQKVHYDAFMTFSFAVRLTQVRKHRAQQGALRPRVDKAHVTLVLHPKTTSVIRRIKTPQGHPSGCSRSDVREHRAP